MINVRIVTPLGLYREMETSILNLETLAGQLGILPNHMPLVSMLQVSHMSTVENGERRTYAVAGGLLHFTDDKAVILTDAVESQEEIDAARAEEARARAKERLSRQDGAIDTKRAEAALKRAMNRLKLKE